MPQHFAGLVRSAGPPEVWMVETGKVNGRVRMMEEARHPDKGYGYLLCYWSSHQHTVAGCWAGTNCSLSPPPERDQSEIVKSALLNDKTFSIIRFHAAISGTTKCFLQLLSHVVILPKTSKQILMCKICAVLL